MDPLTIFFIFGGIIGVMAIIIFITAIIRICHASWRPYARRYDPYSGTNTIEIRNNTYNDPPTYNPMSHHTVNVYHGTTVPTEPVIHHNVGPSIGFADHVVSSSTYTHKGDHYASGFTSDTGYKAGGGGKYGGST